MKKGRARRESAVFGSVLRVNFERKIIARGRRGSFCDYRVVAKGSGENRDIWPLREGGRVEPALALSGRRGKKEGKVEVSEMASRNSVFGI